jgi:enoyl-CoA hydratase
MADVVLSSVDDGVAIITINRPQARNAVNGEVARGLAAAVDEFDGRPDVRVMILTGEGGYFSAGMDLKGFLTGDLPVVPGRGFGGIAERPPAKPLIAAVEGYALAGGFELALSCDLIVADETAVFGLPEVTVGLVPGGGGTQLALRRLGAGRAADLVLTGRKIAIDEAEHLGIVDRRVASGTTAGGGAGDARGEAVRAAALKLAEHIASNSPVAVRAAKRALRNGWGTGMAAGLDIEDAAWRTAALSADRREGIAAFAEKRPPSWPAE